MLTTKNTGLVEGVPLEDTSTMVRIRAMRGFYDQHGQPRSPGDELHVKKSFANFLVQTGKAVMVPAVEVASVESVPPPELPPMQQAAEQPEQPQALAESPEAEEPSEPRSKRRKHQ